MRCLRVIRDENRKRNNNNNNLNSLTTNNNNKITKTEPAKLPCPNNCGKEFTPRGLATHFGVVLLLRITKQNKVALSPYLYFI
jgi:hypothetical protein